MLRRSRVVIGLNSGTSADGVDAAAVEIRGRGLGMRVRCLGHVQQAYGKGLRERVVAAMAPALTRTERICELNVEIGEAFAAAGRRLMRRLGLKRADAIGSHGQTVCHLPPGRASGRSRTSVNGTMQIGEPAVIAVRTGAPVVAQFRQADMAVGGQGAPLVPWTDWILFHDARRTRVIQNIGGIANLTWLPAGGGVEAVQAFDTGPGNMVIDALVHHFSRRRKRYDAGGRWARRGSVDAEVLAELLWHPFLERMPPRSCGREEFGQAFVDGLLQRHRKRRIAPEDWIRTATAFTASSICLAYVIASRLSGARRHAVMDEVVLCGGGARNATLRADLASNLSVLSDGRSIEIRTTDDFGIPLQAKECVSFAILAAACLDRVPANLPQVTGARQRVVLGQVCDAGVR